MYKAVAAVALGSLAAQMAAPNPYIAQQIQLALAYVPAMIGVVLLLKMGLVNFGYAMYFMAGAYAAALSFKYLAVRDIFALLAVGVAGGLAVAALTAPVVARTRGIFYSLLNLALSMIPYGLVLKMYHVTGGSDGVTILGLTALGARLDMAHMAAILTAVVTLVAAWHFAYIKSAYEYVSRGVKENELRLAALGVDVNRFISVVTLYSAALAATSGVLVASITWHVTPDFGHWAQSGLLVLSGMAGLFISKTYGFLVGPVVVVAASALGTRYGYDLVMGLGFLLLYLVSYVTYAKSRESS